MELNAKLSELRKKNGISQADAATRIGVSRQTVSKWESGAVTPDMKNLALIAEVYNVAIEELLDEEADLENYEAAPKAEEVAEEAVAEAEEAAEECECCCCEECEECEDEEEKAAERIYKKAMEKIANAKTVAAEKISVAKTVAAEKIATVEIPKTAIIASLAAVSGTSAVLSAVLKKGKGKTAAAIIAGAAFAAGAGLVIKDLIDRRNTCECCCEDCEDDLCDLEDICDCECCCEAEETVEE